MKLEREYIEIAIQRVQSGELSPAEATQLLLHEMRQVAPRQTEFAPEGESLSTLIARLGTPPDDVLDRWCESIESFTMAAELAQRAIPPTDPDGWYLTTRGGLMRLDQAAPNIDVGSITPELRESARLHAAKFRQQFVDCPASAHHDSAPVTSAVARVHESEPEPEKPSVALVRTPADWRRTVLSRGLVVVCVAAIGAILWNSSQKSPLPIAEQLEPRPIEKGITHRSNSGSTTTEPIAPMPESELTNLDLDQLDSFQPDAIDEEVSIPSENQWLSLEAVMPAMPSTTVASPSLESASSAAPLPDAASSDREDLLRQPVDDFPAKLDTDMPALAIGGGEDPLAPSSDTDGPDESPQPIRQAKETAVRLPSVEDSDAIVVLAPAALSSPSLEFPIDVNVDLRRADADATWALVDRQNNETLAEVSVASDQTEFRWAESAKKSSLANLVCHGSLRDSSGPLIFLRPKVVSDPYALTFDASDARPSWDLHSPLPPRVARVSVDFDLPATAQQSDGIELGWIEPVDSSSPRRTRGLAVLKPIDGETIEVGIRFDLQCSRKLSARVRLFGRLDSSMPWQLISHSILENAADQITAQATRLSQKSTELSVLYSRASSEQRRDLRVYRETIETQSKKVTEASKRIAELQSFINKIEQEVRVRMRIWVQWPEAQQDLLVMETVQEE